MIINTTKMIEYSLEQLIEIFKLHEEIIEASAREMREKYPDNEFYKVERHFNIASALLCICKELKDVKDRWMYFDGD